MLTCCLLLSGLLACGDENNIAGEFFGPPHSAEPHLAKAEDGTVILSFLETNDTGSALNWVTHTKGSGEPDTGGWSTPKTIIARPDLLVNWADFPSVVPLSDELWAAHWMLMSESGGFNYSAWFSVSNDQGKTWSESERLHDDDSNTEHGFVSFYPHEDGAGAVWLDGRNFAKTAKSEQPTGTQLRSAQITRSGTRQSDTVVDPLICDCCRTGAAKARDSVVVAYRGRTQENIRDVHTARLFNHQWTLNGPIANDDWVVAGCPVNGPAIDAVDSAVAVAWYTEHPAPAVRVSFSQDAGLTFGEPIDLALERPIGRVEVAMLAADDAAVSWLQTGTGALLVRRVQLNGLSSSPVEVQRVGANRQAGFPQMIEYEGKLLFAFTERVQGDAATANIGESTRRVRTLIRDIPPLQNI